MTDAEMLRRDKEAAEIMLRLKDKAWNELRRDLTELRQLWEAEASLGQSRTLRLADLERAVLRLEREIAALRERLDSWDETLAVLSDQALMAAIVQSEADIAAGRTVTLAEVKAQLQGGDDA